MLRLIVNFWLQTLECGGSRFAFQIILQNILEIVLQSLRALTKLAIIFRRQKRQATIPLISIDSCVRQTESPQIIHTNYPLVGKFCALRPGRLSIHMPSDRKLLKLCTLAESFVGYQIRYLSAGERLRRRGEQASTWLSNDSLIDGTV